MEKEKLIQVKNLKTYFYTEAGTAKAVDDISLSKDKETMTVRLSSPLQEQSQATLVCKFKGKSSTP